ncbi:MAG: RNA polymerase sporulation sigma factor SigH [Clostridiaceae bacterium]|jgi:RNA polymerase sporulation-specific sigma factor|nr:RNA polymerase sporulation sigma factor SigH [Clostridiaceae bacterium]
MEDEEVLTYVNAGCRQGMEYLIEKYKPLVRAKARSYFLVGADREDIVQEGMIGLFKAVRDYKPEKQIPFKAFADICITRQVITAVKAATRQKHIPLNSYVSLNKKVFDEDSDKYLIEVIEEASVTNPEELLISKEEICFIESLVIELLSPFEKEVLRKYLSGITYQEIAKQLNKPVKSIDNALQRLKKKIEKKLQKKAEEDY